MDVKKITVEIAGFHPDDVSSMEATLNTLRDLCTLKNTWTQSHFENDDGDKSLGFKLKLDLSAPLDRNTDWAMILKSLGIE